MESVLSWILDNFPLLGIIIVVAIVMWFVGRYCFKLEESRKKVNSLPCNDYKKTIDNFQVVKTTVDSINEQVTEISKWIMHFDDNMIDALSRKCSPRVMTKIGRDLFEISSAKKIIDDNIDFLTKEIAEKNPLTAYDVENNALEVLLANLSHPMFNTLKDYIYYEKEEITLTDENGEYKQVKLSLMSIVRLMGLELRDRYLELHQEIK